MTEEQQRAIYEATQDVVKAANELANTVCNLFNEVIGIVKNAIKPIVERCKLVYKQVKKYNCNNWRRNHRLPLIHRKKSRTTVYIKSNKICCDNYA